MKKALAVVLAMLLIGVCTGGALAQVPFVQAYFDADYNDTQSPCLDPGAFSSLYVAALNLNDVVSAIDFKVLFPPALLYVGENVNHDTGPVIGNAEIGEAISWQLPKNGYETLLLTQIIVEWTGACDCLQGPQPLSVVGYDDLYSPVPRAVRFFGGAVFDCVGMLSLICPGGVSTETTTWGGVKALYR